MKKKTYRQRRKGYPKIPPLVLQTILEQFNFQGLVMKFPYTISGANGKDWVAVVYLKDLYRIIKIEK